MSFSHEELSFRLEELYELIENIKKFNMSYILFPFKQNKNK